MSRRPTYEEIGGIDRFDERDTVFSREAFVQGSPEEREYHERHPGKIEIDRELARFIAGKMEGGPGVDIVARAIYEAHFIPVSALALPDRVDGEPSPERIEWEPAEAARRIKDFARGLGADDVRIGPLRPEWVYSHRGARPFYEGDGYVNPPYFEKIPEGYAGRRYGEPVELPHQRAISLAFGQEKDLVATGASRAVDYEVGRVYANSVLASVQLARFIRGLGWPARAHHMRNYLVLAVPVAVDAGIGELARCGYVVSRSLGADFRLATVTTDMPLALDEPVDIGIQDFCEKCRKCATNCPSGAIPEGEKTVVRGIRKWKLDEEKCLRYWGKAGYTCGICQAVCPWTKPRTPFHRLVAGVAVHAPLLRRALVLGDDIVYGARFKAKPLPDWLDKQST